MSLPQAALVLHALTLIGAMALLVPGLTESLGGPTGYLLSLCIYWLGFCLPVWLFHVKGRRDPHLYSERLHWRQLWIPILLLVQVCAVGLGVLMGHSQILTTQGAMLAAMIALINGPLEEIAWRGGFMTRFAAKPRLGFGLSWLLFTAWHAPLLLSQDIVFQGGWMALVGGAAVLGLLWSWIAWRTRSIFWVAIAHVLTNMLTFWVLFNANGFVSPHH
ncbi:MAG: CPBP family intramembrane metalloprotease [Candidatus Devosia phytovorans]|uniref:CPBP family intramembrane metalloprotease n=1 Tax=Candidatus Devosia phytovorans TaxID=3121372 RepID=A0AAJ5VVP9_9HYPH|nr:CPBP family intramembrane glutamic endopeptidase [Devosia sp.]WEK04293.1 MAG: CPBP family intramembrane metalloprotease [Devosia sp.]